MTCNIKMVRTCLCFSTFDTYFLVHLVDTNFVLFQIRLHKHGASFRKCNQCTELLTGFRIAALVYCVTEKYELIPVIDRFILYGFVPKPSKSLLWSSTRSWSPVRRATAKCFLDNFLHDAFIFNYLFDAMLKRESIVIVPLFVLSVHND